MRARTQGTPALTDLHEWPDDGTIDRSPIVTRPLVPTALTVLLGALLAAGPARAESHVGRSVDRPFDPVILYGEEMPAITGAAEDRIGVLVRRGDALVPIPFQIDERNAFGFLLVDQGAEAATDADGGLFDDNDELVFMARDTGPRATSGAAGRLPGAESHVEVEITNPETGARAYAYVVRYAGSAPRSDGDYGTYDVGLDRITTPSYAVSFPEDDDGNPRFYPDYLTIDPSMGGSGEDVLDRAKLRVTAKMLFNLLTFDRDEDDIVVELLGWRDGPVRVVRRIELSIHLFLGLYAPPLTVDLVFYRNSIEVPTIIDSPINFGSLLSGIDIRVALDLTDAVEGARVITADNRDLPPVDGTMSDAESNVVRLDQEWIVLTGPAGHVLTRVLLSDSFRLRKSFHYVDDIDADDDPEDVPGSKEFGFDLLDGLQVPKGRHTAKLFFYFLPEYRPEDESTYLSILDDPLRIALMGPGTVPAERGPDPSTLGDEGWRASLDRIAAASDALEGYEAELSAYSSTYRGRKLEGTRTAKGRFHREPRWLRWKVVESEENYYEPISEGMETVYYGDENRLLARSSGILRFLGTMEIKGEDAVSWWWGETQINQNVWSLVEQWRAFANPGYGLLGSTRRDGREHTVLTLVSTGKNIGDLRGDPLASTQARARIERISITIDPETDLPVRAESFVPGVDEPVAWIDFEHIEAADLDKDDFYLTPFDEDRLDPSIF